MIKNTGSSRGMKKLAQFVTQIVPSARGVEVREVLKVSS